MIHQNVGIYQTTRNRITDDRNLQILSFIEGCVLYTFPPASYTIARKVQKTRISAVVMLVSGTRYVCLLSTPSGCAVAAGRRSRKPRVACNLMYDHVATQGIFSYTRCVYSWALSVLFA
jgi:hypothetical protein